MGGRLPPARTQEQARRPVLVYPSWAPSSSLVVPICITGVFFVYGAGYPSNSRAGSTFVYSSIYHLTLLMVIGVAHGCPTLSLHTTLLADADGYFNPH